MVLDELKRYDRFVIFGAQVIAYGAYTAIKSLTGRVPEAFVVTGEGEDRWAGRDKVPELIEGIPIRRVIDFDTDIFVIVGVTELIQKEVIPWLNDHGYKNIIALTQHEEHLLMSEYFRGEGYAIADSDDASDGSSDGFYLYEVKNDRDKPLSTHPDLKPYERSIQAGAALADTKIAPYTDDSGDNISGKNRMYCEMSATYWVWKNMHHDWVGIEHYRRHLLVTPDILKNDVDAVMPLPYICYPNEATQFLRFVPETLLDALLKALRELHPDKYEKYHDIIYGKYQYTYNLVCARWEVFDEYCSWFFNITEYMEGYGDTVPELLTTRAFSYVAEVLTNIFFLSNKDRLNIVHVEKEIYI